ncbi:alpha/beta hydrolase [Luteolibacter sp. GHJ8]|uniref:Alpha/beta hydrolase n=1 Tax=Luteolibacter rhizosphaerae TaxID=2989719 RepID=A0ABT3FYP0_9BACT|nr:alpha/beta hydrolase [Luteolibacter rhizosphaerae]MCW1912715.1 alpha/beta hydrolase [Luteolibacter rhizosphaerae]
MKLVSTLATGALALTAAANPEVRYETVDLPEAKIFYREAGDPAKPAILLLHGFPSSSHMFRDLIPELSADFHVIAPDLPGFGFSSAPDHKQFSYTFDHLAGVMGDFVERQKLEKFSIYVFDYGAPVGFRLALKYPDRITGIVTQNGNAYVEGLSEEGWQPVRNYWEKPTQENRDALRQMLTLEATRWQYVHGVKDESLVAPESYTLDQMLLDRPQSAEIQLDLFGDYQNNVKLYPKFQEFFRTRKVPTLAVWGKNDPFFLPPGAEAYKRDNPEAKVVFYNTGHFALETHAKEIGAEIRAFFAGRK